MLIAALNPCPCGHLGDATLTVDNNNQSSIFVGVISGHGGIIKIGTGDLELGGTNTYLGGTWIRQGSLTVSSDESLGDPSGGLTLDGGTLRAAGSFTSARPITTEAGGARIEGHEWRDTNLTLAGDIAGSGSLTKGGGGTLILAGDNTCEGGTTQEIVLDGVVSGSSLLEWVIMTGLHRPGASAGFTGLGQGTNIGPGATVMGIDGTAGLQTPNPAENAARGYDQWFAMFGQHAISGDLTMKLEAPTGGGEIHVPDPSVRYEIFKSYAPGGNPINAGWYIGWFNNVTLDPIWPNPTEWVWEFDYLRGGLGHGTEPDPGRAFYSATLMVVPEPGTLVLLAMGAAALLACGWQGRRRKVPRR